MRIIIITTGFSLIIDSLIDKYDVVGIVRSVSKSEIRRRQTRGPQLSKTLVKCMRKLTGTSPATLAQYAEHNKIDYYEMLDGCDTTFENWVKALEPELIVVVFMCQLLKANIFTIPSLGTINLHPSLLPKYRGPNPIFWTYYNMDMEGGVTVHYIDEGEDTGDIIYQETFRMPLGIRYREVYDSAIYPIGAKLLTKSIDAIAEGTNPRIVQPKVSPTIRARNVKPDEDLIDWNNWELKRIYHVLRGIQHWTRPLPTPSGPFRSERWDIVGYEQADMHRFTPSKVYRRGNRWFVACNDGKIYLSSSLSARRMVKTTLNSIGLLRPTDAGA